jgi:molybdate transport system substrate-binding protein
MILWVWMMAAFVVVVSCTPTTPESTSQETPAALELTISAAASLQDALNTIQPSYETANPGVNLVYNFGSSGSLQQQIEQGAPVDVFLSAAPKQMNALAEKGLILEDTRKELLKNTIVLVTPLDKSDVARFADLGKETVSKISIGDPASVPAGQYSKETLESLGLYKNVQSKIVFAKDVRQVLSYVETGNVDAGLVYNSDAQISDQVQVIATASEDSHSPIIYPGAVIADSDNPDAATAVLDYLTGEEAIAIFKRYGFLPAA